MNKFKRNSEKKQNMELYDNKIELDIAGDFFSHEKTKNKGTEAYSKVSA